MFEFLKPLSEFSRPLCESWGRCLKFRLRPSCELSEIFEAVSTARFKTANATVLEFEGFSETEVAREPSPRTGIVFIRTILGENGDTADGFDIVPYDGLVVFPKNRNTTKVLMNTCYLITL